MVRWMEGCANVRQKQSVKAQKGRWNGQEIDIRDGDLMVGAESGKWDGGTE